jgi:hypothetical protein
MVFEVTGEAFDVDAADAEEMPVVLPAPDRELSQIRRVASRVKPRSPAKKPTRVDPLQIAQHRPEPLDSGRASGRGHGVNLQLVAGVPDHGADSTPGR